MAVRTVFLAALMPLLSAGLPARFSSELSVELAGPLLAAQPRGGAPGARPTGSEPTRDEQARSELARIAARLPHDPEAFTQGLVLSGGVFFESTGLYGESSLRRVDPASGRVLSARPLPETYFGEGLALCPQPAAQGPGGKPRLVQLTWKEGVMLAWDAESLRPLGSRPLRGQGWGLACREGTRKGSRPELVLSDGSATLRFLDAQSLAETGRTLAVRDGGRPVGRLNELEMVNGWLLANVWEEDRIAVIRLEGKNAGAVALWIDLAPLRRELPDRAEAANGMAYDPEGDPEGGHGQKDAPGISGTSGTSGTGNAKPQKRPKGLLYVTGKRWDTVFALRLPELLTRPPAP